MSKKDGFSVELTMLVKNLERSFVCLKVKI